MTELDRNKEMRYFQRPYGFIRVLPEDHMDVYIHDALTNIVNRKWWRVLLEKYFCSIVGHIPAAAYIGAGYHKKYGSFECSWCLRCRASILYYSQSDDVPFDRLGT